MGEYTIRDNPIVKGLLIGVILFISGVGSPCVQGLSESTINAEKNWWGAEDGSSGIGPGSGDSIFVYNSNITFEPWLHHPAITKPSFFRSLLTCILARVILHDRQ